MNITKTAQFTPGPWAVCNWMVGNNVPTGETTVCGPNGDEHICTMDGNENNQANAHLIAAAPAMYAAGTLSLDVMERIAMALERMGNEGLRSIVRSAIIEQKTALAQAENKPVRL